MSKHTIHQIGVIGGGAWGTALATALCRAGRHVTLWAREEDVVEAINTTHTNPLFLPDIPLPNTLKATGALEAMAAMQAVLVVAPAQFVRATLTQLAAHIAPGTPLILASKGVEESSLKLMSEVAEEVLPSSPILILSGPSFADEVARGQSTHVSLAGKEKAIANTVAKAFASNDFHLKISHDVAGAQMAGAVKNILAIGCGILVGQQAGENARAAFLVQGMADIRRLIQAKGGRAKTAMELCGLGDVLLTCSSEKSRNMSLGIALGKGQKLEEILAKRRTVAEGVHSAGPVIRLAEKLGVRVPACEQVHAILQGTLPATQLMSTS